MSRVLLGGHVAVDLLGIAVGHVYYFLEDVYPLMTNPPIRLLRTPLFIRLLFDRFEHTHPHAPEPLPQEDLAQQPQ